MESIRNLFLNYFAALRIPLTLPAICRIKSLAIQLFVQQLIHADINHSHYWLCEGVGHRRIPSETNVWSEFR